MILLKIRIGLFAALTLGLAVGAIFGLFALARVGSELGGLAFGLIPPPPMLETVLLGGAVIVTTVSAIVCIAALFITCPILVRDLQTLDTQKSYR